MQYKGLFSILFNGHDFTVVSYFQSLLGLKGRVYIFKENVSQQLRGFLELVKNRSNITY